MISVADVYKGYDRAGRLRRFDDRVEFSYLVEYEGEPVASTLPVTGGVTAAPAGQLPPFFTGLLPEGRRLSALTRALKVSADDEMSLLVAVGADTVGDVRVVPGGEPPVDPEPVVGEDWNTVDLFDLFNRSLGDAYDRSAIPGIQPKLSGKMISFPVAGMSGPVIVKLDPPEYPRLTANEAAILAVADQAGGFAVPKRLVVSDSGGAAGLVVSRFDRAAISEGIRRFPVEDGCQVAGRYPADKYSLDTVAVIEALAGQCAAPPVARLQLLERFLLSYLVGDGDLHAKNLAIWRAPSGLWEPAPVYDLVCTAVYGDTTLAAPLNGSTAVHELGRRRFLAVGTALGIPEAAVARMLDRRVPVIAGLAADALEGSAFAGFSSLSKVKRFTSRRAERLLD